MWCVVCTNKIRHAWYVRMCVYVCVCVVCVCVLCVCVCVVCGTNGVFSQKGIHTCQSSSSNLRIH